MVALFDRVKEKIEKRGFGLGFYPSETITKNHDLEEVKEVSDYMVISNVFNNDQLTARMAEIVSWGLLPIITFDPNSFYGDNERRDRFLEYVLRTKSPGRIYFALGNGDPEYAVKEGNLKKLSIFVRRAKEISQKIKSDVLLGILINFESLSKIESKEVSGLITTIDFAAVSTYPKTKLLDVSEYYSNLGSFFPQKDIIVLGLGTTEENQPKLIYGLSQLAVNYRVKIFIWKNLYDPKPNTNELFQQTGLIKRTGVYKSGFESWKSIY